MRVGCSPFYRLAMTNTTNTTPTAQEARQVSRMWLRIFALVYDPFLWLGEIAGLRRRRRALLSKARGRVVEIGAGTGLNAALYPEGITELILTEPDAAMRKKLERRLQRDGREARIVDAPAEQLPVADASVDTVVSTLVLCTVPDPERTLNEIARVLSPGGQLLFIEHVRAKSRLLASIQDYLFEPWRSFACGCCCNRPTAELLHACGFDVAADEVRWHGMPAIVRPLIVGLASR
jgi:ubiquinone/menaquinone biosynthesis C-methylase UbiE